MTIQTRIAALPVSEATRAFLSSKHNLLIGAQDVGTRSGSEIPVHDPATGAVVAAVAAARAALEGPWSKHRPADRERLLLKLADAVEADGQLLAEVAQSIHIVHRENQ